MTQPNQAARAVQDPNSHMNVRERRDRRNGVMNIVFGVSLFALIPVTLILGHGPVWIPVAIQVGVGGVLLVNGTQLFKRSEISDRDIT